MSRHYEGDAIARKMVGADFSGNLPLSSGTYALLLVLPQSVQLRIGALGEYHFSAGWYVYVGSALGPGGLAARVGRHIGVTGRSHWHIDYLTRLAATVQVIWHMGEERLECSWAQSVGRCRGAKLVVGFRGKVVERVEALVTEINIAEGEADRLERELSRILFSLEGELDLMSVVLWYRILEWIGDLADYAEKVGNNFRLIIAR